MDEKKIADLSPNTPDPLADYAWEERDMAKENSEKSTINPEKDNTSANDPESPVDNTSKAELSETKTDSENPAQAAPEIPEKTSSNNEETSEATTDNIGGTWSALYNGCAKLGPLVLILIIACLSWHDFWRPENAIYCPSEIKAITAFLHGISLNSWLDPTGLDKNMWVLAQWPGFFWFTGLLALIPGIDATALLLPLSEALAACLTVLGVWTLAIVAGFGSRVAFASAAILLCAPIFAPLPHFMGAAPFASACLIWSLVFFYKGWQAHVSIFSLPAAFILTGLAGLSGGVLYFAVPLLANFIFLIWCGKLHRAHALDALIGFALMLILLGGWLGWVILSNNSGDYLSLLFTSSFDYHLTPKWFLGLLAGIAGLLPWILMIFGVSWFSVLKNASKTLSASRTSNGSALIWISWILACAISIFIPSFHSSAVLIACLGSLLLGKAFMHLSKVGNPFFFLLASLCLIIAGLLLLGAHFEFSQSYMLSALPFSPNPLIAPTLLSLSALPYIGGLVLAGGMGGFFFVRRNRHGGGLIYAILLVILITQLGRLMLVPELAANPNLPLLKYGDILNDVEMALKEPEPQALPDINITPQVSAPETIPETPAQQPESNTPQETGTIPSGIPEDMPATEAAQASEPAALPEASAPIKEEVIIIEKPTEAPALPQTDLPPAAESPATPQAEPNSTNNPSDGAPILESPSQTGSPIPSDKNVTTPN